MIRTIIFTLILLFLNQSLLAATTEDYMSTSNLLISQIKSAQSLKQIPNVRNPDDLQNIKKISMLSLLNSYKKIDSDANQVMEICQKSNEVIMSYAMYGMKNNVNFKAEPSVQQKQMFQLLARNSLTFEKEINGIMVFFINCQAVFIPKLKNFYEQLPLEQRTEIRINALRSARRNTLSTIFSSINDVNNPKRNESLSLNIITAWAENISNFVGIFTLEERSLMSGHLIRAKSAIPKIYHEKIDIMNTAFLNKECNTICKIN